MIIVILNRFTYDSETGDLCKNGKAIQTWRELSNKGEPYTHGRNIDGVWRQFTHIIWFGMTQEWPAEGLEVDHRDRDITNNRWSNLRLCTKEQNRANRDLSSTRIHGIEEGLVKGVTKVTLPSGSVRYQVMVGNMYCGFFKSSIEANGTARRVRRQLYGDFDLREPHGLRRI